MKATLNAGLLAIALAGNPAVAGQGCVNQPLTVVETERALAIARQTESALDASPAKVVLLARSGQDLTQYGLRYSHLGIAIRDPLTEHGWRVVHKLNECGTDQSHVFTQGLADFFMDHLFKYEASYALLNDDLQDHLMTLLKQDKTRLLSMHEPRYNMLAYPWSTRYQQSNQWVTETLALAMDPSRIRNREQAQAWLKYQDYQPTVLTIRPFTRLGARATRANIAFDDHPNDKRFSDHIETTTVDSIFAWLERSKLATVYPVGPAVCPCK